MSTIFECPKCGKPMPEEAKMKGVYMCPDYKVRLNDAPPYRFKCTGLHVTDQAGVEFQKELRKAFKKKQRLN